MNNKSTEQQLIEQIEIFSSLAYSAIRRNNLNDFEHFYKKKINMDILVDYICFNPTIASRTFMYDYGKVNGDQRMRLLNSILKVEDAIKYLIEYDARKNECRFNEQEAKLLIKTIDENYPHLIETLSAKLYRLYGDNINNKFKRFKLRSELEDKMASYVLMYKISGVKK